MQNVRALLLAKEAALTEGIEDLTRPPEQGAAIGFGKRIGDGTTLAVQRMNDVAAHERMQEMLELVRRAKAKLDEGTYGKCDVCGQDIGDGRLEARFWATTCITHAR